MSAEIARRVSTALHRLHFTQKRTVEVPLSFCWLKDGTQVPTIRQLLGIALNCPLGTQSSSSRSRPTETLKDQTDQTASTQKTCSKPPTKWEPMAVDKCLPRGAESPWRRSSGASGACGFCRTSNTIRKGRQALVSLARALTLWKAMRCAQNFRSHGLKIDCSHSRSIPHQWDLDMSSHVLPATETRALISKFRVIYNIEC